MDTNTIINVTLELTCFAVSMALLMSLIITKSYRAKLTRILTASLTVSSAILLFDAISWMLDGREGELVRVFLLTSNYIVYLLGFTYLFLVTYYVILYVSYRNNDLKTHLQKVWTPLRIIFAAMVLLTLPTAKTGWIFWFDETNTLQYGAANMWLSVFAFFVVLINIGIVIYGRRSLEKKDIMVLLLFLSFAAVGTSMEAIFPDLMITYFSSTLSFIVMYVGVQIQQEVDAVIKENEIKTSIMLSQIQPHFLYNSLLSIEDLCSRDPEQAEVAIRDFSKYLRSNLNSLTNNFPIPFEKELEHVKTYLSLEKRRFEERLEIVYDINAEHFLIPALTLQPLVENAVQHGVTKRIEGGTVIIRSSEDDESLIITVKDNGVGFEPEKSKAKSGAESPHIGIDNVRYRLERMAGGKLEIESKLGVGTKAVITLPKKGDPR